MITSSYPLLSGDGSDLPSRIEYAPNDKAGVMAQKKRLAKLDAQRPAWIKCPANDNKDWPLAQWLRKDGNEVLLKVAQRYRAMYDASIVEVPLIGAMPDSDMAAPLDQRVHNREDGSVGYKGVRRVKGAIARTDGDDGTSNVVPINDKVRTAIQSGVSTFPMRPRSPVMKKWNGDRLINAAIDSRKGIRRLRDKLGPLVEAFEDAVLHGETLAAIGEERGGPRNAGVAGRVLVILGLEVVQRELAVIDREERAA